MLSVVSFIINRRSLSNRSRAKRPVETIDPKEEVIVMYTKDPKVVKQGLKDYERNRCRFSSLL